MSEIEPYFDDTQVAKLLDPTGQRIKARSIRSERESGRLVGTKIAGKWLYRQSDVVNFLEAARCQEPTQDRGLSLSARPDGPNRGSTSPGPRAGAASDSRQAFLPPILTRPRPVSE